MAQYTTKNGKIRTLTTNSKRERNLRKAKKLQRRG